MRQKKGFVIREVCGKNVVVGEGLGVINFGKLLTLNETAAWLWKKCEELGDFTIEELTNGLCQKYNVSADEARQDVSETIAIWQKAGVIED